MWEDADTSLTVQRPPNYLLSCKKYQYGSCRCSSSQPGPSRELVQFRLVGDQSCSLPRTAPLRKQDSARTAPLRKQDSSRTLALPISGPGSSTTSLVAEAQEGGFAERCCLQVTRYSAHISSRLAVHHCSAHHLRHNYAEKPMNSHDSNSADKPSCARFEPKMMLPELGRSQAR